MAQGPMIRFQRRNSTLPIVAGIAQGAAGVVTGFQNAQKFRAEQAYRQALLDMRREQVEVERKTFEAKYGPVKTTMAQLGLIDSLTNAGADVPNSVRTRLYNDLIEQTAQSPELIPAINASAQAHAARQTSLPDATRSETALQPVPDPKYPNPNTPSTPAPGNVGADTELHFGGMEINTPVQKPEPKNQALEFSRPEWDMLVQGRKARAAEKVAETRIGGQLAVENLRGKTREELIRLKGDIDAQLETIRQEGANQRNSENNQTRIKTTNINAAKSARSNTPANLDRKSILKQIDTLQKQKGDLLKPGLTGASPPMQMVQGAMQWYDGQIAELNKKLQALPPEGQGAAPAKAAPAVKPAAGAAPAKAAPAPKSKAPPSGLPKRWDPVKDPDPRKFFQNGDVVEILSGDLAGKRVRFDNMQTEEYTVLP